MEIIKRRVVRPNWTEQLRSLKLEAECLRAPIEHHGSIRTMATRLTQREGLYFTFSTEGNEVLVWRIPVPARRYKSM